MSGPALGSSDVTVLKSEARVIARLELENRMSIAIHESSLPISIGRGHDCDISIPDSHISRHHCEVSSINGVLCLRDMSVNGTFVGERKVTDESITIPESCRINLGGSVNLTLMPEGGTRAPEQLLATNSGKKNSRTKADRREDDRRQDTERRSNVMKVDFERRDDDERRARDRRTQARRHASG